MYSGERSGLEFDGDVAMQAKMIEQQVDVEILAANLKDETAVRQTQPFAQLQHETGNPAPPGRFQLPLVGFVSDTEKIENIKGP